MVIFDFDLTLVDTKPVEALRAAKRWWAVKARIGDLRVYDGVHDLLRELHEQGQTLAIVTKSPNMIPLEFIKRYGWPIDTKLVLGHHQIGKPKPHPDGLLKAMKKANAKADNAFHVGDQPEDTQASRAANITAIGAGWGAADTQALKASKPDYFFDTVADMREFFVGKMESM